MSDSLYRFIPANVAEFVSPEQLEHISKLSFNGAALDVTASDVLRFADAGDTFEGVRCPLCGADILAWWPTAMSATSLPDGGFEDLKTTLPCCGQECSLDDLAYSPLQGFYRYLAEGINLEDYGIGSDEVLKALEEASGFAWRLVYAHY